MLNLFVLRLSRHRLYIGYRVYLDPSNGGQKIVAALLLYLYADLLSPLLWRSILVRLGWRLHMRLHDRASDIGFAMGRIQQSIKILIWLMSSLQQWWFNYGNCRLVIAFLTEISSGFFSAPCSFLVSAVCCSFPLFTVVKFSAELRDTIRLVFCYLDGVLLSIYTRVLQFQIILRFINQYIINFRTKFSSLNQTLCYIWKCSNNLSYSLCLTWPMAMCMYGHLFHY